MLVHPSRAPELFYGARVYGTASDMWSVGCIYGEIRYRRIMFMPDNMGDEIDIMAKIFHLLGKPVEHPKNVYIYILLLLL